MKSTFFFPVVLILLGAMVSLEFDINPGHASTSHSYQNDQQDNGDTTPVIPSAQALDTLRVLIYNVRHGAGMDLEVDLERTAAVLAAQEPDIVLLQEIDSSTVRTNHVDQAATLARLTQMPHHKFGAFMDYDGGRYGMAVLSAWPILSSTNHRLPDGSEPRSALAVRIQPGDHMPEMVFVGIHLYQTAEQRLAQARQLVSLLDEETVPIFLGGDFNSQPDDPVMRLLDTHWTIPEKSADAYLTLPADTPRVEIDYIMYRPAEPFTVIEHRVIDEPMASDHRPVLLVLTVQSKP